MGRRVRQEVWLAGKGPSIDTYDWSKAGRDRIAINEAAFIVPGCTHAIACDREVMDKYLERLHPRIIVLRPERGDYDKYQYKNMIFWNWDELKIRGNGTIVVALQVLYNLGARTVHMVGFDSIDGNAVAAPSIIRNDDEGTNMDQYKKVNEHMFNVIANLPIAPIWEHRNDN